MGKRKITCNNASCKHHISGGGCDTCIMLDGSGKCKSFEKGFAYYFHIVYYNDCNGVKWLYVVYKNIVGYASSKYLSK